MRDVFTPSRFLLPAHTSEYSLAHFAVTKPVPGWQRRSTDNRVRRRPHSGRYCQLREGGAERQGDLCLDSCGLRFSVELGGLWHLHRHVALHGLGGQDHPGARRDGLVWTHPGGRRRTWRSGIVFIALIALITLISGSMHFLFHLILLWLPFGQTFCDLQTLLHTFLDFLVNITK